MFLSKFMKHLLHHQFDHHEPLHTLQHGPIHAAGQAVWSPWVSCSLKFLIVASYVEASKPKHWKSSGSNLVCMEESKFSNKLLGKTHLELILDPSNKVEGPTSWSPRHIWEPILEQRVCQHRFQRETTCSGYSGKAMPSEGYRHWALHCHLNPW